ncbi:Protein N-acetyltransferase, RimJ/RimL family [Colwellia chukchiensis]|uniref:Protein N-acetyltransferase, RimJ/RimL family n=1 Tax=Colwellia chukchiensis TaxID=641665 RepID=A0A1H7KKN3_9GAMM|nr:GNAT family protein [Colwellia chukchiensis]SEK87066.1 Protein N-acetyltransferase, RimJ/RimL family [Colwellia chukchiensis]
MKVNLDAQQLAPTLKADNIYLRPATMADYSAIKAFRQNPENCRYIRPPESDSDVLKVVQQLSAPWQFTLGHWNGLVICLQADDSVVGEIVFRIEDWQNQRAELGYRLSETVTGQGICTKAAHLLIHYLFNELGFFKIVAKCDPRNIASYRVMEKLGFVREAFFKQHYLNGTQWTDQVDYGLLRANWQNKQTLLS